MKLVTYLASGGAPRVGIVTEEGSSVIDAAFDGDMVAFIADGEQSLAAAREKLAAGGSSFALDEVKLLAPLAPPIILNSGQNYWDHRDEKPPVDQKDPEFFLKAPLAVIGPGDPVILDPIVTKKLDYEVELAVVIGKPGRHIPVERALDH
ncbi:MAG: fumarylacetoacetate hydrolase family protein, partial [Gaiella sp.]